MSLWMNKQHWDFEKQWVEDKIKEINRNFMFFNEEWNKEKE